ncbi:MAG: hypothetical protein GKS00_16380 [Alphaproteobacteria bacterium]|nr:hypothetical protein [Alphaproteobacteria bacterium]
MYGILRRQYEESGTDQQERLMLSFDKMFSRERDTALGDLFSYWRLKCAGTSNLPNMNEFSSRSLLPQSARRFTSWLETETSNPLGFVLRNHPKLTAFGDHSNHRLGELTFKMNAKAIIKEYLYCKSLQRPLYHEIEQTVESNSRHFVRLLLPVVDDSGDVTRLVYAVRLIGAAAPPDSPANS